MIYKIDIIYKILIKKKELNKIICIILKIEI